MQTRFSYQLLHVEVSLSLQKERTYVDERGSGTRPAFSPPTSENNSLKAARDISISSTYQRSDSVVVAVSFFIASLLHRLSKTLEAAILTAHPVHLSISIKVMLLVWTMFSNPDTMSAAGYKPKRDRNIQRESLIDIASD